jgi:hypothetical protein
MDTLTGDRIAKARRTTPRRWRLDSYLALSALIGVWAILIVVRHIWDLDVRLHTATLYALARNLWDPLDPMVGAQHGSLYFSPYMFVLALPVHEGWLGPTAVLCVAALVNVALVLWGFRRFCAHVSDSSLVAAIGLVFMAVLWGWHPLVWSGLVNAESLAVTLPFPSVMGLALTFFTWDALLCYRSSRRPRWLAILAVLLACTLLVNPFSALNAAAGLAAFAVSRPRQWRRADLAGLVLAGAAAFGLALAWPYANILSAFSAPPAFAQIHHRLVEDLVARNGLVILGVPALIYGFRRKMGRELLLLFLCGVALIGYAAVSGSYGYARALPLVGIPAQVALAAALAAPEWRLTGMPRVLTAVAAALAFAAGLLGAAPGILRAVPGNVAFAPHHWRPPTVNPDAHWSFLGRDLRQGDVVIAQTAGGVLNEYGIYTVAPSWPDPAVPDAAARQRATATFFFPATTPAERLAIADRYHVRCLLSDGPVAPAGYPGFRRVAAGTAGQELACRR